MLLAYLAQNGGHNFSQNIGSVSTDYTRRQTSSYVYLFHVKRRYDISCYLTQQIKIVLAFHRWDERYTEMH
jgi:hypothetical protein